MLAQPWPRWLAAAWFALALTFVAATPAALAQDDATPQVVAEGSGAIAEGSGALAEGSGALAEGSGAAAEVDDRTQLEQSIDAAFSGVVGAMASVLMFELGGAPLVVLWLIAGALFLTIRMSFINIRGLKHAVDVVRGRYDDPDDEGEVSHFQALSSALSATVGLGNIAGVAIAVSAGGPGAIFWMVIAAFFGMASKFTECTLGQKYRVVDAGGNVLGGPMRYLEVGLAEKGLRPLGKALAVIFAIFCIGGSFGGGNMFQANQAYAAFDTFVLDTAGVHIPSWLFGVVMMAAVGVVILGGIRRIAAAAEKIVPLMCTFYVIAALFVIIVNLQHLDDAIGAIVSDAFTGAAMGGGLLGVIIQGFKRAAFSNEAGIGSAAIAHSAARTDEPVREGFVALLEPFIDTVIVCLATGLVIVVSGVDAQAYEGAVLTAKAFETVISWFPLMLSIAIILFAYSTMISWSYYGERSWTTLFGPRSSTAYRVVFLLFIFIGSIADLGSVIDFSDLMILSMAFPNILGLYILSGVVKRDLDSYWSRLRNGDMDRENDASRDRRGGAR